MKRRCSLWEAIIGIGIGVAVAIAIGFGGLARPIAMAIATPIPIPTFLAFCFYLRSSHEWRLNKESKCDPAREAKLREEAAKFGDKKAMCRVIGLSDKSQTIPVKIQPSSGTS